MKFNKYLVVPAVALTLFSGMLLAAHSARAMGESGPLGIESIVQKLATRFNLNEAEVKAVFDEQHAAIEQEMQTKMAAELDQAVSEGKLTEEQKQKIIAKRAEMRASHQGKFVTFKAGENPAEKELTELKAAHEQEIAALKQWATDNNVPFEYLMPRMVIKHAVGGPGIGGHVEGRDGFFAGTVESAN